MSACGAMLTNEFNSHDVRFQAERMFYLKGDHGRETADGFDGTERLDAAVEKLRWYTSVLSERASASSMSTPR